MSVVKITTNFVFWFFSVTKKFSDVKFILIWHHILSSTEIKEKTVNHKLLSVRGM